MVEGADAGGRLPATGERVISLPTVGVDPKVGDPVVGGLVGFRVGVTVGEPVGIIGIFSNTVGGSVSVNMGVNGAEVGVPVGTGVASVGFNVSTFPLVGESVGTGVLGLHMSSS